MTGLTAIGTVGGLIVFVSLVVGIAHLVSKVGPRIFGDDPGGRDPDMQGQFRLWGTGPNYIELLRAKEKLLRKQRRRHARK